MIGVIGVIDRTGVIGMIGMIGWFYAVDGRLLKNHVGVGLPHAAGSHDRTTRPVGARPRPRIGGAVGKRNRHADTQRRGQQFVP
ncbi:hypothetical protein [Streptomyces sp. DSM 118878]